MDSEKFEPYSKVDKFGNMLKMYYYPNTNCSRIALKLETEKRERELGVIEHDTKTLSVKRERKRHLFMKFNAYGFNYTLCMDKIIERIVVRDEFCAWEITPKYLKEKGKILNFKNNGGFEVQIFLSLKDLDNYKLY